MKNIRAKVYPYNGKGNTIAFVNLEFDIPELRGIFVVKGLTLVKGKKGMFVSFPSQKNNKDGKYYDTVYPTTREDREAISTMVIEAYSSEIEKVEQTAISKFR